MIRIVNSDEFFQNGVEKYIVRSAQQLDSIKDNVNAILNDVKKNGDSALLKYTKKFDGIELKPDNIKISEEEIKSAYNYVDEILIDALRAAIKNIRKYHLAQIRDPLNVETMNGVKIRQILRPIESAGLYIPGGRAIYPSTVLMTSIPAIAAGVDRIIMCSPPGRFEFGDKTYIGINPSILVAAHECGINEIYKVGGAQAIAAMAFGTETIKSTLKIVGPGNKFVNAAKQIVSNIVSIDTPAGPSEVGIIADKTSNEYWVALDLMSQIEHGPDNIAVLISDSNDFIEKTLNKIEELLPNAPRRQIIQENLKKNSLAIKTENIEESIKVANEIAVEHLQIMTENYQDVFENIKNAGAIFLGNYTPVPLGDYCAGTNHVLPTGGTANRFSGLNTLDFMKIISTLEVTESGIIELEKILSPIAEFEGLIGHRNAVSSRLKNKDFS